MLPRAARTEAAAPPVLVSASFLDSLRREASSPLATTKARAPGPAVPLHAGDRKRRILELDSKKRHEDAAKVSRLPTEAELAAAEATERSREASRPILRTVRLAREEELDEVKEVAHKVANALVMDDWLHQQARKAALKEEERRIDASYAAEVTRADAAAASAELRRRERDLERERHVREVLRQQMEEREARRELDEEATALEAEAILRQQAATAAEAERLKAMAAERARRGREDLDAANAAAQARKAAQREVDAAEDRAVLHAMEAKARLDAERVAQRERQHREREHAFAERLKKQQRVADTRGNDDEVRAKRAEEARVLAQRAREAAEAERKAAFMRRVMEEREAQVRLKAVVDAEEKAREEALALEVLRKDAEQALAIRSAAEHKAAAAARYREELQAQIRERDAARTLAGEGKYAERLEMQREEMRRARIVGEATARKVEVLRHAGVSGSTLMSTGLLHK